MRRGAALVLLALARAAAAEEHCDGGVCISTGEGTEGVDFSIRNSLPTPIGVRLTLSDLDNVEPSPAPDALVVVGASASQAVARLAVQNPARPYRYRFAWHFWLGDPKARHDDGARYRMPFGGDAPRELSQGPNGKFSHRGEYAFDFPMPIGTPVLAAREGIVVRVVDRYERGAARRSLIDEANVVVVAHSDGTFARYTHLKRGAVVEVGQRVSAGEPLGRSGNTGFSARPHLHFEVYGAGADGKPVTLPIRFESEDPRGFEPRAGSFYPPQR